MSKNPDNSKQKKVPSNVPKRSAVAAEREGVVSLPGCPARRPCLVVPVSLST